MDGLRPQNKHLKLSLYKIDGCIVAIKIGGPDHLPAVEHPTKYSIHPTVVRRPKNSKVTGGFQVGHGCVSLGMIGKWAQIILLLISVQILINSC